MRGHHFITPALVASLAACGPRVFEGQSAKLIEAPVPTPAQLEAKQPKVEIVDDKIVIHEKIQFEYNAAKIRPESDELLAELAKLLADNPQISLVHIEGHASAEGSYEHNVDLSRRRAKAVLDHLVEKGEVPAERLESEGYGPDYPIADNETEEGREANRRVEFTILEQAFTETKTVTDPETGEQRVTTRKRQTERAPDEPSTDDPPPASGAPEVQP